ncbi:MAG: hypothetical protein ABFS39_15740, partial [Pseudomonadota bacterium]
MITRNMTGFFLTAVMACWTLGFVTNAWAQDPAAIDLEKRGRAALESGSYPDALKYFSEGSSRASDPNLKARLHFRQAVTLQQMAGNPEFGDPKNQLRRAARMYHVYLKTNPDSAAAANNLAKIYEQFGNEFVEAANPEQARRHFIRAEENYKKAVKTTGARQGMYLKNYADFLEGAGNWERAKIIYAQIIAEHPLSPALQQSMADSYGKRGLDDLAEYLWNLLDAGYVRQSTDFALDAIQKSSNQNDKSRIELLTIVCASLAEQTEDRRSLLESETGGQISALAKDKFLAEGAAEIIRLHQGRELNPGQYRWWAERKFQHEDPAIGLWPVDGFRALIRSLGSRSKRSGDPRLAEAYFRLAADLQEWEIDPMAVRALVQMHAEANSFKKIDEALSQYQIRLFEGKGQAYRESQVGKIFQYHQTLGELYALIERWGDSGRVDSAIFQLEHAREKSMVLQNRSSKALPEKYQFTPPMVDILATGYKNTGKAVQATELRIQQA